MTSARPFLTIGNDDGVGYSAITEKGIFGERWVNVAESFDSRPTNMNSDGHKLMMNHFKDDLQTILTGDKYSFFEEVRGASKSPILSVIMHARMATNKICIENTHPFYRKGVTMTHNGVITNDKSLRKLYSSCDSEVILNSYVDNEVAHNPDNIKKVGKDLWGGYACGVLTRDKDNNPIMDIFRNTPFLYMTYVTELDAVVICTNLEIIDKTLDLLKWNRCEHIILNKEKMLRMSAITGEFVSKHDFSENGYGNYGGNNSKHYDDITYTPYKSSSVVQVKKDNVCYIDKYKEMNKGNVVGPRKQELDTICGLTNKH